MKNAVIIHGTCSEEEYFSDKYPALSNNHWFPWLQKQLLIQGVPTQTPEIPEAYKPQYDKWKRELERFDVNENTILIGHSCGGGFLIRWLTENKTRIDKLILVAPWLDPDRKKTVGFFKFEIDPSIQQRLNELHIFVSSDDEKDILASVEAIKKVFPQALLHEFSNKGHFTLEDMGSDKFPELLDIVK